jgi:hypothetical protein
MKIIISTIDIKTSLQQFASTTTQYIDERMKAGYATISPYLLSPQWLAGYNGLKKLIEKDYCNETESPAGSQLSS